MNTLSPSLIITTSAQNPVSSLAGPALCSHNQGFLLHAINWFSMLGRSGSRIPMSQIFLFIMLTIHETPALSRGWNSNQVNSITELLILIFYRAPSAQQVLLRAYMGVSLKLLSLGLFFSVSPRRHACIKHFAKMVEVHNWIQSKYWDPTWNKSRRHRLM